MTDEVKEVNSTVKIQLTDVVEQVNSDKVVKHYHGHQV